MSPPPVPKPRSRFMSLTSSTTADRSLTDGGAQQPSPNRTGDEAPPPLPPGGSNHAAVYPTLAGVTDMIAASIPSLAGVAAYIGGSAPPPAAPPTPSAPSAPPSIDSITNKITANIPSLAGTANALTNPEAPLSSASTPTPESSATNISAVNLDNIVNSLTNIPSLAGIVSGMANTGVSSTTTPSAPTPPSPADKPRPASLNIIGEPGVTDVGALSHLVMSALDQNSGVTLPSLDGPADPPEDGVTPSPNIAKGENPYITVLASWASQEESETESSNEEEETGVGSAPSGADGQMNGDPATMNTPLGRLMPTRPAPPPPNKTGQSGKPEKPLKQKTPRTATIRVSRKKGGSGSSAPQSAVAQSSWLDMWKGFRHSVLWATFDGQVMSLWKKRTDRFSEVLFHVSSITNIKKQDKGRFSVYFRKKHYDFMAHNDDVQEGWVTSLLASRGQPSPPPPKLYGSVTIKDPRSRVYAAVWGHDLWVYSNKDSYQLGVASFSVPLNLATVKTTGRHSFSLITPYKTFSLSVDSTKDLPIWVDTLSSSIRSALSSSQVATRLWENPHNKVCGDCGSANPEWASVNLLLVICDSCAGHHRALGSKVSKVRSLKMDSKVWTEPLIQLFVTHGNRLANQVWAPFVPATEQLRPDSSEEEKLNFIQDKYSKGRYRRVHALASSRHLMDQRLREVVCGDDIEETMSLICSGAKVCQTDLQSPSPIQVAERAGQALQTELLRLNEYIEVPPYRPQSANGRRDSPPSGEEEELHGKLEEDRFLFSLENDAAACDVLDLREVLSVYLKDGSSPHFELVTLTDELICAADSRDELLTHLIHILKVILPVGVAEVEVGGASAISKVCVVEVGRDSSHSDAWLLLWRGGVSVYPTHGHTQQTLRMPLSELSQHEMDLSKNTITIATADGCVSVRFEKQSSCQSWFTHLNTTLTNQKAAPLYPSTCRGSVPPGFERCISHITSHGLKVEGVYRRCGLAPKVSQLVEALMTSPSSAPLESDEQGVLDASSTLKQLIRHTNLIPERDIPQWLYAAGVSDERSRFSSYRQLLRKLSDDSRATLSALFGHFYIVQVFSQVNKMSAHNLAVVLLPSLFQTINQDLLRLIKEFIIHHTLLFLTPEEEEEEEQITVF
ncbi:arf-GAP with Rho-GAP domain, ANK repeat and PH domain-containing protein 1 isoform X2 [Sphaeramia orbicularis]|uniref:arf-GAP with Rho-GAP domain, ANK repeat and PH domain-containing protein 1 isoform X2 n=1 Tax=Sphaeramia orbicularis TaxID=375764 RepID=UPI00117E5C2C|nr:arf-GAP with Rho-GAP domain, ANK repeat and PH domain-containing protein 1-like isoform X2 [Sphaeramia orbicularis]